jgi:hypothetical protein
MKSLAYLILSFLLVTAILAPSIITLANNEEKTAIAIDFNEEEKKEVSEKDFFINSDIKLLTILQRENTSISSFYVESEYSTSIAIFLPPPEHIS